jgi:hypothetical protein
LPQSNPLRNPGAEFQLPTTTDGDPKLLSDQRGPAAKPGEARPKSAAPLGIQIDGVQQEKLNPSSSEMVAVASDRDKTDGRPPVPGHRVKENRADALQEAPDLPATTNVSDSADLAEELLSDVPIAKPEKLPRHQSPSLGRSSKPLNPSQSELQKRIRTCLAYYLNRPESVAKRSPWGVMHAMLPYGPEANLIVGSKQVNAIAWLCQNGKCRTQRLFELQENRFTMAVGPGVQGHEGQFLAMLAQSYVPSGYPMQFQGRSMTVADLIRYEMAGCREKSELTFKLIGLSHYMPANATWVASDRARWNLAKMVKEELDQPIVGAACGGTHRLMGLTYAIRQRHEQGFPIDGEFHRASVFIEDFIQYAWSLQNPDGSFSTEWFAQRGNDSDVDRKVQTTGHILEWLVYTVPEDQLRAPRVERSVRFLLAQLLDRRDHDWAIGPRGHALRAMALYDQRVFGAELGTRRSQMAQFLNVHEIRR